MRAVRVLHACHLRYTFGQSLQSLAFRLYALLLCNPPGFPPHLADPRLNDISSEGRTRAIGYPLIKGTGMEAAGGWFWRGVLC
jgi:hypothetical protein